ncbi:amino acid adenylation domain-containing protein [Saccharothrix isguenensis]
MTGLFVERFEARAAATPDAVAVVDALGECRYGELNARANRLAHALVAAGIGPEDLVALVLPRTVDVVVALLGVLKAGAAYLPVDDGHPPARVESLLAAAAPRLVITSVDQSDGPDANPVGRVTHPEQAAYVITTSGSTGEPKGIVVPHRALAAFLARFAEVVPVTADDRVLAATSVAFDASVVEIHLSLVSGATIVLAPNGAARDPGALADLVARTGVTVAQATPSVWRLLLDCAPGAFAPPRLLVGAEPLPPALAAELRGAVNLYGPTETTVWATAAEPGSTTIGRPLPGMALHLLDERLDPVADGAVGEVHLGGAQVTRGYLGRPGATAERFVADPFGPPGTRMYRTGDLARRTPTGELEFLGRSDDQVKIRGNRVEPAEVVAALSACPGVSAAAVVVVPDGDGKRLVGFVTGVDGERVRRHLVERLPEYLVPSRVIRLDRLPVTVNGKVDRAGLTAAATTAPAPAETTDTVAGTSDRTVRRLFADALGLPDVGEDDDFVHLGGHSLSAVRLAMALSAEYGVNVSVGAVFRHRTPAALAGHVAGARPARSTGPEPTFTPGQHRLWLANRRSATDLPYHEVHAWRLTGPLDVPALRAALVDVSARQPALRTAFPAVGGLPVPRLLDPDVPLEDADDLAAFASTPFDLTTDRPLRAALLRDGTEHVLALLIHHIATDGPSTAPLVRDLSTAYAARIAGQAPKWTGLPPVHHREPPPDTDFWRAALADLPDELPLPTDRPRPAVPTHRGGAVGFTVDAETHHALTESAARRGATLFMVLHAAVAALFTRLGAGTDIPLGTPVAGRTDPAQDDVVGFFANTLVLRADTSGDPTFAALLDRVRVADIAAYEHSHTSFERLVEALAPVRHAARNPLFQTMLVLEHGPDPVPELPGLRVTRVPWRPEAAMFDLTFHFVADDGVDGRVEYAADLFDRETAEALGARLVRLLRAVASDPDVSIGAVDLLSAAERRDLARWSGARR